MHRLLRPPSPALSIACIALAISLGGVGYAATVLPRNSVGTPQLKRAAVTTAKLRNNAVTSQKVRNGSLLAVDFRPGQLPAGPPGPKGDKGDKGDAGPTGPPGVSGLEIVTVGSATNSDGFKNVIANCPSGKRLLGGGAFALGQSLTSPLALLGSRPVDADTWQAVATEVIATSEVWVLAAYAICANVTS